MNIFAEWVRNHSQSIRSEDPCYSVAAIGGDSSFLVNDLPPNSFGEDSFFDRFSHKNGKILNLNFDAGSTFIHYVERKLGTTYRFDKTFQGEICNKGVHQLLDWTIWVRYLSDDALEFDSKPFDRLARDRHLFPVVPLGRGQMGLITAQNTFTCIAETLPSRPWFLTRAESLGISNPKIIKE